MSLRIIQISVIIARLPLRRTVRHAGATYGHTENIFVRCRLSDGTEGWGEGVPRKRLLGSSAQVLWDYFWGLPLPGWLTEACGNWSDVTALCEQLGRFIRKPQSTRGFDHPLRCALELSIFDAFARAWGQPLSEVIWQICPDRKILRPRTAIQYSATITAADPLTEIARAVYVRLWGFSHCKIKVGLVQAGAEEIRRLRRLRILLGPEMDIRLDANGAWTIEQFVHYCDWLKDLEIRAVEDPVPPHEIAQLTKRNSTSSIPIILDESIVSPEDVEQAAELGCCDLINIRLSKCGGLLGSIKLAVQAKSLGLGYQLGCHPGETGILSAAGRHFATTIGNLRYVEGSFDRYLFSRLITREDVTFGRGGWAPALGQPGLGVTVDRQRLAPFIIRERTVNLL